MIFYLSKILWVIVQPANFLLLILALGLWRLARTRRRRGMGAVALVAWCLVIIAVLPVGQWVIKPLEDRFPQPILTTQVDGIIVLGGGLDPDLSAARGQVALNQAGERVVEAAVLARRFPDARILLSGGNASLLLSDFSEAAETRDLLVALGVDAGRIILEDRSRTTYENAVFSKAMVQPKPGQNWLLVTSAAHMPRAIGCFRHVDWDVIAYPVDYETSRHILYGAVALDEDLVLLKRALHEWVGLVAYHLMGRIEDFFPAPGSRA